MMTEIAVDENRNYDNDIEKDNVATKQCLGPICLKASGHCQ